ncbi:MAG: hypothetical protein FWB93_03320 [Oscillospiraceae bacterium]|nr:hypothetical protein [Oscillospiraceae bacterium]
MNKGSFYVSQNFAPERDIYDRAVAKRYNGWISGDVGLFREPSKKTKQATWAAVYLPLGRVLAYAESRKAALEAGVKKMEQPDFGSKVHTIQQSITYMQFVNDRREQENQNENT